MRPAGDFVLGPDDRSIQVHSCHGQARQVQVLRDAILHLLAEDPSLREDDIAVLSPAIDQFAPLVQAGFGASVEGGDPPDDGTPRLSYRITDRSLRESYPALAALDALLALVSGRFSLSEVMEFVSLPVVTRRFNLDDDGLRTIAAWVSEGNVRWGLNGPQRTPWGLPAEFAANTWRHALDRILMGVAVSDDEVGLAPGGIAPLAVESGDIAVAGRLADLVGGLEALADDFKRDRSAAAWCEALRHAIDRFFAVEEAQQWQLDKLRRLVAEIDGAGERRRQPRNGRAVTPRRPAPARRSAAGLAAALGVLPRRDHREFADAAALAALPRDLPARSRRGRHERRGRRRR